MNAFGEFAITLGLAIAAMLATQFGSLKFDPLSRRTANCLFVILLFAYMLIFGTLSILRHESFHSGGFDLGIFDQVIWNSAQGRLFDNSIRPDATMYLGQHFAPLLLAIVPLYAIWNDPRMLLLLQTLALGIAALPIYWFAQKQIGNTLAFIVALTYFLFPSLQYVNLFEFHEIVLGVPLLAFATFFLLRRQYKPFLICWSIALLTKEDVSFITVICGLYVFFFHRNRRLGVGLTLFGLVYALVMFQWVIPFFFGKSYDANSSMLGRYGYLGNSLGEISITALTQPLLVAQHLLTPLKIEFVLQLLVPLALIPLLGGEILFFIAPIVGYLLLGESVFQNTIRFHYTAPMLPIVFFAQVIGLRRLIKHTQEKPFIPRLMPITRPAQLAALLIGASLINYFFQSGGPFGQHYDATHYKLDAHTDFAHQLTRQIPSDAPLVAESNLVPHLSHRQIIYQAPVVPDLRQMEYLLVDTNFPPHAEYADIWTEVITTPFFETLVDQDGYILKKRTAYRPTHTVDIQFDQQISLIGYTIESKQPISHGETTSLVLVWRADQTIRERYIIFMHVIDAQGKVWTQGDREPGNSWFRTDRWNADDVTPDRYTLELPADIPSGNYQILVGLYGANTNARLNLANGNDHTILTSIQVR